MIKLRTIIPTFVSGMFLFVVAVSFSAAGPKLPETPANVEKGWLIYFKRCSFCHGLLGDGNGPAAKFMDPRPRDFTLGVFKFRTTKSGELPLDEDLFMTVSQGLAGTAMQGFDDKVVNNGLTNEERWQVVYYIKTFAPEFANPEYDPKGHVINFPKVRSPYSEDSIKKGESLFLKAKCWECHGKGGKGDGLREIKKDDWGFPVRIRNITQAWKLKGGSEVEDIYMRFSTGISGTPMPSFEKTFSDEERWQLANYVKSLQITTSEGTVIKAKKIEGLLPDNPASTVWQNTEPVDVKMAGQVIASPRWQSPSVELVTVRALYNESEIAFLLNWDDPFEDITHDPSKEFVNEEGGGAGTGSYVAAHDQLPRGFDNFRDSIALQFPVNIGEGTKKPHFFRGDAGNPVNLWVWKADKAARGEGGAEESNARGYKQPLKVQAPDQQQVESTALWKNGTYRVVMKRSLKRADRTDVQFEEGKFIPVALNAWDGSNGEHGLIMSLSSWHYLLLELPTPANAWLFALLGIVLVGLGELWLVRKLNG